MAKRVFVARASRRDTLARIAPRRLRPLRRLRQTWPLMTCSPRRQCNQWARPRPQRVGQDQSHSQRLLCPRGVSTATLRVSGRRSLMTRVGIVWRAQAPTRSWKPSMCCRFTRGFRAKSAEVARDARTQSARGACCMCGCAANASSAGMSKCIEVSGLGGECAGEVVAVGAGVTRRRHPTR